MRMQTELRAANMTWNYYAYGRTVHAFTLMENPIWNGNKDVVCPQHLRGILSLVLSACMNCYVVASSADHVQ